MIVGWFHSLSVHHLKLLYEIKLISTKTIFYMKTFDVTVRNFVPELKFVKLSMKQKFKCYLSLTLTFVFTIILLLEKSSKGAMCIRKLLFFAIIWWIAKGIFNFLSYTSMKRNEFLYTYLLFRYKNYLIRGSVGRDSILFVFCNLVIL